MEVSSRRWRHEVGKGCERWRSEVGHGDMMRWARGVRGGG